MGAPPLEPPGQADVVTMTPGGKGLAMKTVIGLALVGALSLALVAAASAGAVQGGGFQGGLGGAYGQGRRPGAGPGQIAALRHHSGSLLPGRFQNHGKLYRGCCWGAAYYAWPVGGAVLASSYYADPSPYPIYAEPAYAAAPTWEQQGQMYLAPPAPSEQCYVGGCYRLQGDGMSAFRWVWFPTVPEGPPAPPAASPAAAQATHAQAAADPAPSRPAQQLYRWVDEEGVANWTNNREAVPERHRAQLKPTL